MGKILLDNSKYIHIHFDVKDGDKASFLYSKNFATIFRSFLRKLREESSDLLTYFKGLSADNYLEFYQLLERYELKTVLRRVTKINSDHVPHLISLTEAFFLYWRGFERYAFISEALNEDKLLDKNNKFNAEVSNVYQNIMRKLHEGAKHTYRLLTPGLNALFMTRPHTFKRNRDYNLVNNIPFVSKVIINTPYIVNTKSSVKRGNLRPLTFSYNPLKDLKITKSHFYGVALKVGALLAFVYIHRDYLVHLVALTNLFEVVDISDVEEQKPDLFFLFGVEDDMFDAKYYHDPLNDTYIGFMMANEENDYFGYFKDMLLTLHNIYMLDHSALPVPGTLLEINIKPNIIKKVLFFGDTSSGKYEVIEVLNLITNEEVSAINVISDSYALLKFENDGVYASGTEIGGFLEKEALKAGHAYLNINESVILNPISQNPRYVMPLSNYKYINQNHKLDLIAYVNNHEDKDGLKIFLRPEDAISVFRKGSKKVMTQSGEIKETSMHFANPLAISQYRVKTDGLITKYFKALDEQGVYLGELYTKLYIKNESLRGVNNAALALLKFLEQQ